MILEDLENALAEHAPPGGGDLSSELPPLTIDGIPVSVDKMTQVGLNQQMALQDRHSQSHVRLHTHTHLPSLTVFAGGVARVLNTHF